MANHEKPEHVDNVTNKQNRLLHNKEIIQSVFHKLNFSDPVPNGS